MEGVRAVKEEGNGGPMVRWRESGGRGYKEEEGR